MSESAEKAVEVEKPKEQGESEKKIDEEKRKEEREKKADYHRVQKDLPVDIFRESNLSRRRL